MSRRLNAKPQFPIIFRMEHAHEAAARAVSSSSYGFPGQFEMAEPSNRCCSATSEITRSVVESDNQRLSEIHNSLSVCLPDDDEQLPDLESFPTACADDDLPDSILEAYLETYESTSGASSVSCLTFPSSPE